MKKAKHKTFTEYLEDFYANKPPLGTKKKKRVIVSAGRVIF